MKKLIWFIALTAALSMTGLLPFENHDVASLVPVEALTVDLKENRVILRGKDCQCRGEDWHSALEDLQKGADGTVFLGTAEQVVLSQRAVSLLPDIIRSQQLRPAAVICVCPDEPPDPEEAAKYLSAHDAGITLQKVQAVLLRGEGIALPMLIKTEGGLKMNGLWKMLAVIVKKVAVKGAGFRSIGCTYEPKVPEELK